MLPISSQLENVVINLSNPSDSTIYQTYISFFITSVDLQFSIAHATSQICETAFQKLLQLASTLDQDDATN